MESIQSTYSAHLGEKDDFEKLEHLMQANCTKLGLTWDNYLTVAKRILNDKNLGKFVYVETEVGEVVGFLFVTYEWSDWRNGIFFWLQAIESKSGIPEEHIFPQMKQKLEEYANNDLGYRWCGIRLCNEKSKSKDFEPAVRLFDL